MYCRYCGTKLLESANFCTNCGKKVPKSSNSESKPNVEEIIVEVKDEPFMAKASDKVVIGIVAGTMLLSIILILITGMAK